MTNCGPLGWVTDEAGYRYQALHPETGQPWPAMPDLVVEAWKALARYPHAPESCLVNYYGPAAKMGLHQDRDERDLGAPVVSLSLGDTCLFRIGGTKRSDPTRSTAPCLRGRRGARRRGAISLPRRRPHHPRDVDPVAGRRAHQSHAATGHRPDGWQLVPRTDAACLLSAPSLPGLTPQVGFTRLAARRNAELGQARVPVQCRSSSRKRLAKDTDPRVKPAGDTREWVSAEFMRTGTALVP